MNIAETKWIVVGLDMMPFSDFRYFVSVLKFFSMLPEVKCSGIESSAAFFGFIFLEVGFCLLVCFLKQFEKWFSHANLVKYVAARKQQAKFVNALQSLP